MNNIEGYDDFLNFNEKIFNSKEQIYITYFEHSNEISYMLYMPYTDSSEMIHAYTNLYAMTRDNKLPSDAKYIMYFLLINNKGYNKITIEENKYTFKDFSNKFGDYDYPITAITLDLDLFQQDKILSGIHEKLMGYRAGNFLHYITETEIIAGNRN